MGGAAIAVTLNRDMRTSSVTRAARSLGRTTSDFIAFLRRPTAETVKGLPFRDKAGLGIWLFILSIVVTTIFGVLALPVILWTDLTFGEQLDEALGGSVWSVVLSVVMLGPLVEEIIFRGWLSGTWRAVLATMLGLVVIYGGSAILDAYFAQSSAIKPLVLAVGAAVIFFLFSPLDDARRIAGFDRVFPVMFYAQAVTFGTLHFQNYAASSPAVALFATLPLIACGLIWGYARVRLGFASAVFLHAAYNVPAAFGSVILAYSAG